MLAENEFRHLADATFREIMDGFEDIDADEVDLETAGNTLTLTFRSGQKCVLNTQGATCQLWLAGGKSAWHFDYDPASKAWIHDKGTGDELLSTLSRLCVEATGQRPKFAR